MPSGAKLTLKATKARKAVDINIKIQFINSPFQQNSIVKKINNQATLEHLVQEIEKDIDASILDGSNKVKLQGLTRVANQAEFSTITLAQFGVENNVSIRLVFEATNKVERIPVKRIPTEEKETEKTDQDSMVVDATEESPLEQELNEQKTLDIEDTQEDKELEDAKELEHVYPQEVPQTEPIQQEAPPKPVEEKVEKHVYVYKAPETPIQTYQPEDADYDVTVSHARQYQSILSQRAHESYKSKRLRQEANKKHITNIEVRIRFPDDSNLQVNFTPQETNKDLYNLVSDTLVDNTSFRLSIPYPVKDIANDDTKLTANFESRNLLLFKSEKTSGPYLKSEYLQKAKDLNEAEDVKLDLERHNMKDEQEDDLDDSKIQNGVLPKKKDSTARPNSSSVDKNGKKVPNWLKFGKK